MDVDLDIQNVRYLIAKEGSEPVVGEAGVGDFPKDNG